MTVALLPLLPIAEEVFRWSCELSLAWGLISDETFDVRRAALDTLLDHAAEWSEPDASRQGPPMEGPRETERASGTGDAERESGTTKTRDPFVHFIPIKVPGLTSWHFHLTDADPYPSVPHGHHEGRPHPKLDPYLGWIYDAHGGQTSRVSKNDTRALWNDEGFRLFALKAIDHFVIQQPYHPWRVRDPRRLPRVR